MLATEREITNKLIKQKNQIKKNSRILPKSRSNSYKAVKTKQKINPEPCIAISQWGQSHSEVAFEFQHTTLSRKIFRNFPS